MKKILIATCMMLGLATAASAQKVAPSKPSATTATAKPVIATAKPVTTGKPAVAATPVKADGTPDMRFKANQKAAKTPATAGPKKADGTPDMRYKANQKTPKAKQ